ncbi:MAG: hypothetical protein EBU54_08840, partial [Mycobacteriaceae bacterium]|nr:hypothetical protein [Mycobacteriaceae bacterium]
MPVPLEVVPHNGPVGAILVASTDGKRVGMIQSGAHPRAGVRVPTGPLAALAIALGVGAALASASAVAQADTAEPAGSGSASATTADAARPARSASRQERRVLRAEASGRSTPSARGAG